MKTLQKILKKSVYLLSLSTLLVCGISCSDDDNTNTDNLSIKAQASNPYSLSRNANNSVITVSEFKINMKEIELEIDDDSIENENDAYVDSNDEIELQGPFELDLLSAYSNVVSVEIPEANYEEIEFEFDVNTDSSSDMFNKTVVIEGTIDAIPFVFWHNFEEDIEVDFENEINDISITSALTEIIINFDLDIILSQVDISTATDADANGTIEISPEDLDGNNELANELKNALKNAAELLDD